MIPVNRRGSPAIAPDPDTYWELDVELRPESEELWGLFCYERGALGAEVLDDAGAVLRMRYQFGAAPAWQAWPAAFSATYPAVPAPLHLELRSRAVEPWASAWRVHFQPLRVGRRLLIVPPWEPPAALPDGAAAADALLRIVIDPGQGFGTGWHASTALALEALEAALETAPGTAPEAARPPRTLLDVGTGSGILAIAGGLLGVERIWALEIEAPALPEVRRNFALSGLPPPIGLVRGRPDCLRGQFAVVVANIIAEVLLAEAARLAGLTAPGGYLILSGILADERAPILDAYAALGLHPHAEHRREGWVALALRRS